MSGAVTPLTNTVERHLLMPNDGHTPNGGALQTHMTTDLVLEMREIGGAPVETSSARRLHAFLENGDKFAGWIADRIRQYGFVEGQDYVTYSESTEKGRPSKEYAITLDMAKELSMVERNAKGKQARRYFIECEKRAKATGTIRRSTGPRIDLSRECRLAMSQNLRIAKMCGFSGSQAVLSANKATVAMTGVDTLLLMGATHITAPRNEALLTPTEIGNRAGIGSARVVNLLLSDLGYQQCFTDAKSHKYYEPTEMGIAAGGVMQDTGKKHSNGTPVRQLRWASSIIDHLKVEEAA